MVLVPAELPFAPRPYVAELLSSWLLRVAAANLVSLRELLEGFAERYGPILSNVPIDYAVPDSAIAALAQFCRIVPEKIRTLDLRQRVPHLSPVLLLRYLCDSPCWMIAQRAANWIHSLSRASILPRPLFADLVAAS